MDGARACSQRSPSAGSVDGRRFAPDSKRIEIRGSMERARSVLATMISVQTRHIIARGRLYINSLFADVSSPFLPTYWLGNYRMAKYDYEVSGRAWSYDRVLPLASAAFPHSNLPRLFRNHYKASAIPVDRNPRDNPEKSRPKESTCSPKNR
ncbi:hypothetical protein KAX17_12750 [Candidatus Bipolaricaulota bacterium]|nr:hypothetical protein [Candidatus Bipolaricaulota bacterium]